MYRFVIGILAISVLAGCTTTKQPTAVSHLQIRMSHVEDQLDDQSQQMTRLTAKIEELSDRFGSMGVVEKPANPLKVQKTENATPASSGSKYKQILRVPVAPQEVQTALRNAGYYSGEIDGKLGPGSKKAIKDFQYEHDLERDGIVGKKTWAQLKNYLD